ncbi:MAG TPA: antibiotic biosynthesis monooxygenase family protein [Mycobacteriales bacterium]|nr:antibiotic biosynthesis monooxygenase family protein [Mycobacteriales bacterium]
MVPGVVVVSRFDVPETGAAAFEQQAGEALSSLAQRPGFLRGRLGRCLDEPGLWALVSEWDDVGSYRRGLGAYDVKLATAPLMALSVPEPGAFEVVSACDDAAAPSPSPADRAR